MQGFKDILRKKFKVLFFCVLSVLLGCDEDAAAAFEIYFQMSPSASYIEKIIYTTQNNDWTLTGIDSDFNQFSILNENISKINVFVINQAIRDLFGFVFLLSIFKNENAEEEIKEKLLHIFAQFFDEANEVNGMNEGELQASKTKRLFPLRVRIDPGSSYRRVTSVNFEVGYKKYPFKKTNEQDVWIIDLASLLENKDIQNYALRVFKSPEFANISSVQDLEKIDNFEPLDFGIPMSYITVNYARW